MRRIWVDREAMTMVARRRVPGTSGGVLVVVLAVVIGLGSVLTSVDAAQTGTPPPPAQKASTPPPAQNQGAAIPPDQLDALVAPIALYPDPLLAQTLAASTYPLEIIQLQQWLAK